MYQHLSSTCIWSIYLSVDTIFHTCGSYQDFLGRVLLLNQRFLLIKLKSSRRTFYGRNHDLVDRYGISVSQMITSMFHVTVSTSRSFHQSWRITGFVTINTTGASSGAGTAYPSGAPEFTRGFTFFFWHLLCLFFFDFRILITPFVSSNSSSKVLRSTPWLA